MNKSLIALMGASILASSLFAGADKEQIRKECEYYATQEAVPQEELAAYMKDCMRVLEDEYRSDAVGAAEPEVEPEPEEAEPAEPKEQ